MFTMQMPRLRFIEGEVEGGGESEAPAEVDTTPEAPAGNPAWDGIRTKLDPTLFSVIEPELKAMDLAAQQRIQRQNEQYKPYKGFAEAGTTPEKIQQALSIAEQLDANPEAIYTYLGDFLKANGRMPSQQEMQAADDAGELEEDDAEQPDGSVDPRIAELEQGQARMREFLENQQFEASVAQESQALDNEIAKLKGEHPELTDADVQEMLRRAAFVAQSTGKVPSMEAAYADYSELRNRILTTPRPGDSAPKLLPTSGGVPSSNGQQRTPGQLSRTEMQDFTADYLQRNRG